jgi:hypothetical protein
MINLRIQKIVALAILIFLSLFLRLYRLNETSYFNYDEARDAIAERAITQGHLTLLGPETVLGNITTYFGPAHYYLMAPALFASHLDPLGPYIFTTFLATLTALIIWLWSRSYLAAIFYATFPIAVFFGRNAWNPNAIPFFVAAGFCLIKQKRYLLSGIFFGIAIQLHWTAGLLLLLASLFLIKEKLAGRIIPLLFGSLLGLLPIIIFDFRHDFLYLRSLVNLTSNMSASHGFPIHYLIGLLPLLAFLTKFVPKKIMAIIIPVLFTASLYMVFSLKANHQYTIDFVRSVSRVISQEEKLENPTLPFNIVSEISTDARAFSYRYFLGNFGVKPLGPEEYPVADHLYVMTDKNMVSIIMSPLYEISSFKPRVVSKVWTVSKYYVYRLEK